jgi:hypothetical protein
MSRYDVNLPHTGRSRAIWRSEPNRLAVLVIRAVRSLGVVPKRGVYTCSGDQVANYRGVPAFAARDLVFYLEQKRFRVSARLSSPLRLFVSCSACRLYICCVVLRGFHIDVVGFWRICIVQRGSWVFLRYSCSAASAKTSVLAARSEAATSAPRRLRCQRAAAIDPLMAI